MACTVQLFAAMLRQGFLLITVASVALAAVARIPLETKPDEYKGCAGCWISAIQEFLPINGTSPVDDKCEEYFCTATEVQIFSCGAIGYDKEKCYLTSDPSQCYPDCCPKPVCPSSPDAPVSAT